jgi:hypothetical protein
MAPVTARHTRPASEPRDTLAYLNQEFVDPAERSFAA